MTVGKNTIINDSVIFRYPELVTIGNNCIIDPYCYFSTKVTIGNNVHIGPGVYVIGGKDSELIMEDFSGIALGSRLICGSDDFINDITGPTIPKQFRPNAKCGTITMHRHSLLGCNCVVHPNIEIWEGIAFGSGTIIRRPIDKTDFWPVYGYNGQNLVYIKERNVEQILKQEKEYLMSIDESNDESPQPCTFCKKPTTKLIMCGDTSSIPVCEECYLLGRAIGV